jgi:A/G-specific adenine glycosylase
MINPTEVRRALLKWYDRQGRAELPWRIPWNPYHILVSEFMLQQTTVATVIPYFHRFLKKFPTLRSLAKAPQERVLELWSGLGYYARGRNLHAAAQKIERDFGGNLPDTRESVQSLPGIGPYTAGALLSFAYNKPEALVDGNVIRVLSRLDGIRGSIGDTEFVEKIWARARTLVPPRGARLFNSALMDLGATVCRPDQPDCPLCPFKKICWANEHKKQGEIPAAKTPISKKRVFLDVALVENSNRWLLTRRPERGLYGGLWEFPTVEKSSGKSLPAAVEHALTEKVGFPLQIQRPLPPVRHILSHRELILRPWLCRPKSSRDSLQKGSEWCATKNVTSLAISSLTRRIFERRF